MDYFSVFLLQNLFYLLTGLTINQTHVSAYIKQNNIYNMFKSRKKINGFFMVHCVFVKALGLINLHLTHVTKLHVRKTKKTFLVGNEIVYVRALNF